MCVHTCSEVLRCDMLCGDCDAVRYRICIMEGWVVWRSVIPDMRQCGVSLSKAL